MRKDVCVTGQGLSARPPEISKSISNDSIKKSKIKKKDSIGNK